MKANVKPKEEMYGDYVIIDGELTEEKLAKAKEEVLESVFDFLKKELKDKNEFFIVKDVNGTTSVGFKCIIPFNS